MVREYTAFISYRHLPLDKAVADKLHKSIERYVIPRDLRKNGKKTLGLVFRDQEELPLSNDLSEDIFSALDHSDFLIVVCTPETSKSMWVRREIRYFIEKHGRNRVITVVADGTPETAIPVEVTTTFAEDGVTVLEQHEPLCAFVSDSSQKKVLRNLDKELLRLYAAILEKPYDSLRQRHKRRRLQRVCTAMAAAFFIALAFVGVLVDRNMKINEQRQAVQLRESELLTIDAQEALRNGDTRQAIQSAISALPQSEEERPYYAPAEQVLLEAMDIYGEAEAPVLLRDIRLEQMTSIANFALSPDGTRAVTIDDYGVVHCFDTADGGHQWSETVAVTGAFQQGESHVRISGDQNYVLCCYGKVMEIRNLETGELYWSKECLSSFGHYFIYDDVQNRIALLQDVHIYSTHVRYQELTVLSAETGEELLAIPLRETVEKQGDCFFSYRRSSRLPAGGAFSEDGQYFACAYFQEDGQNGTVNMHCYVVDLDAGTVVTQYTQEAEEVCYVSNMIFREDALLIALETTDLRKAASVLKLDWPAGTLQWQMTTPAELDGNLKSQDMDSFVLFWETVAIAGRRNSLYMIELETGDLLASNRVPGTLTGMFTVSNESFAFTLDNGTYGVGWCSQEIILSTSDFFQTYVSVGRHERIQPYGGGILQYYSEEGYYELSVSNAVRKGYLALVPEGEEKMLLIKQPMIQESPVEHRNIGLPVEARSFTCTNATVVPCGDEIILGMFSASGEDGYWDNFYVALDKKTHEVTRVIDVEDGANLKHYFLPDGFGYLQYDVGGTTMLYRGEEVSELTKKYDETWPEEEQYPISNYIRTDTNYLFDGTVLTAHCDTHNLTVLRNGVVETVTEIPQSDSDPVRPYAQIYREVKAGANGWIMLGLSEELGGAVRNLWFYDSTERRWVQPEEITKVQGTGICSFSKTNSCFASVDESHMVRVWDMQTANEIASFPLQLPYNCVLFMDFLLDDSCIVVKTLDAQILIYEISTGALLIHEQLETPNIGGLRIYEDTQMRRLYILDSYLSGFDNGVCIDLDSWTTLGSGGGQLYYDAESRTLLRWKNTFSGNDPLWYSRIPTTQELIQIGREIIS